MFHDLGQRSAINPNKYGEAPPLSLPSTPLMLRSNSNSLFSRTPHKNLSKTAWWKRLTRSSYSFALPPQTIIVMREYGDCTAQASLLFFLKR